MKIKQVETKYMEDYEGEKMVGYLVFMGPWDGFFGLTKGVYSPLEGSAFVGENREKIASQLFAAVATELANDGICSYALTKYAHDTEVGRAFVLNGFGIRCTDASMDLHNRKKLATRNPAIRYRELVGDEKRTVVDLKKGLVKHLSMAPTFMPSDLSDFSQRLEGKAVRVFAAYRDDEILGYLSFRDDGETFVSEAKGMANICGAYVKESERGTGLASELLEYVCKVCEEEGYSYLGVDCETLNPTALRFWGKYFESYTYSYHRRIDERCMGYEEYMKKEWENIK